MRIIIVCTGNTCRSPMAEAIFKRSFGGRADIISRGLYVPEPVHASFNAEAVMKEMELDISDHVSVQLDMEQALKADLILTMTQGHKNTIISVCPQIKDKVFTLCEYAGLKGDIPDPYGGDMNAYRSCAEKILQAVQEIKL